VRIFLAYDDHLSENDVWFLVKWVVLWEIMVLKKKRGEILNVDICGSFILPIFELPLYGK